MSEIHKISRILTCLQHSVNGLTNKEISQATGFPVSTTFRILKELQENGFIFKRAYDNRYLFGEQLLEFCRNMFVSSDLLSLVSPYITLLHQQSGFTVFFSSFNGVCCTVMSVQGPANRAIAVEMGEVMPLHCSAAGKIVLAYMKKKPQEELLAKLKYQYFTANTPLNRDLLNQQLEEARENGYYINYSEFHDATNAISAPVFDAADICGSITVVGTAEELPPDRMPEVARRLKIISRHVTLKLIDMHWITHPS